MKDKEKAMAPLPPQGEEVESLQEEDLGLSSSVEKVGVGVEAIARIHASSNNSNRKTSMVERAIKKRAISKKTETSPAAPAPRPGAHHCDAEGGHAVDSSFSSSMTSRKTRRSAQAELEPSLTSSVVGGARLSESSKDSCSQSGARSHLRTDNELLPLQDNHDARTSTIIQILDSQRDDDSADEEQGDEETDDDAESPAISVPTPRLPLRLPTDQNDDSFQSPATISNEEALQGPSVYRSDGRTDENEYNDNLIQAELVTERSERELIQAVEVDPDADDAKPIYLHRHFKRVAIGMVCLVLVIIAIVAVVSSIAATGGTSGNPNKDTSKITITPDKDTNNSITPAPTAAAPTPTLAPTVVSENEALIKARVSPWLQDPSQLNNASSPYYKAFRWIVYHDIGSEEPDSDRLQERYLLASFYFATSVERPWLACNPPAAAAENDDDSCQHQLYDRNRNEHVNETSNRWLSTAHECDWAGVNCHSGYGNLKAIKLIAYEMSGTLIPELGLLSRLGELDVRTNRKLGGAIPSTLGLLQDMHKLWLSNSGYAGTLPVEICNASGLKEFHLSNNFLTGTIPSCLGNNLSLLEELAMETNELTGTIPSELGRLQNLEGLELNDNKLSGEVPEELCSMGLDKLRVDCGQEDEYFVACGPSCGCEC